MHPRQIRIIAGISVLLFFIIGFIIFCLVVHLHPFCYEGYHNENGKMTLSSIATNGITWIDILNSPAYVINMDRSIRRWYRTKDRAMAVGFNDVRRFRAVDGKIRQGEELRVAWNKYPLLKVFPLEKFDPFTTNEFERLPGEQGCLLSWLNLLEYIAYSPYEIVTVFEDDVLFDKHFVDLAPFYYKKTPKDFDFIYMGFTSIQLCGNSWIVKVPVICCHAMIFTRNGAKKLYNAILERGYRYAIDRIIFDLQKDKQLNLRFYCWNKFQYQLLMRGLVLQDTNIQSTIASSG